MALKKKAEHTPGPWLMQFPFVYKSGDGHLTVCRMQGSGGQYVADCELELDDPRLHEIGANCHLIAAAPDLLAACEAVLACPVGDDAVKRLFLRVDGAVADQLRAVIAKAKGLTAE